MNISLIRFLIYVHTFVSFSSGQSLVSSICLSRVTWFIQGPGTCIYREDRLYCQHTYLLCNIMWFVYVIEVKPFKGKLFLGAYLHFNYPPKAVYLDKVILGHREYYRDLDTVQYFLNKLGMKTCKNTIFSHIISAAKIHFIKWKIAILQRFLELATISKLEKEYSKSFFTLQCWKLVESFWKTSIKRLTFLFQFWFLKHSIF